MDEEGEAEMMDGEGGESELSDSSESVAFDQILKPQKKRGMEESDDEETKRK